MANNSTLLYQIRQIRQLEEIARINYNISVANLMERAGKSGFQTLKKLWPKAKKITVVCGGGNNGGDGYVIARLAKIAKLKVKILQLVPEISLQGAAQKAALKCRKLKITTKPFVAAELQGSEVIVDALLGTGLVGKVRKKFVTAINHINSSNTPILAIDVPSGIDADTGNVLGMAIKATATITFIGCKIGLFIGQARDYCGKVWCNNLSLPAKIFQAVEAPMQMLNLSEEIKWLSPRKNTAHKGDFGHVLIIGGDYGMGGAARMAAEAALRVGAGLVTVATRPEHAVLINATRPEIMSLGVVSGKELQPLLLRSNVVLIGPGLGKSRWGKNLLRYVLATKKSLVVDADALNILALSNKFKFKKNWVLTPHPGEAARLLHTTNKNIQHDRVAAVKKIQQIFGGVTVLKGAGTLIATPGEKIRLCDAGNPGMASGGMGDILSGMIAGFLAQGLSLFNATKLGVIAHAQAGDMVAKKNGGVGMLALDLLPAVRKILQSALMKKNNT